MLKEQFDKARHGSFLDKPMLEGETFLTRSVMMGEAEAIRDFIAVGADPDAPNAKGERPLDMALRLREARCVEILVAYDADISRKVNGKTFRQRAQEANFQEAVEAAAIVERRQAAMARAMSMGGYI